MEIIKFFKDAKGLWHVNNTIMPSGKLALRQLTNTSVVMTWLSSIGVNQNNNKFFEGEITDIKREDGTSYATIAEFLTECGDFFVDATQLLEVRVAALENRQNLFIDHWTIASANVLGNKRNNNGVLEEYDGSAWVVVAVVDGDIWFDSVDNTLSVYTEGVWMLIPLSSESVYINRADNISYVWTGSMMTPASSVLSFVTLPEVEVVEPTEDSKVTTVSKVFAGFKYWIVNSLFTGLSTTSKTIQGAINETFDGIFNRAPRVIALGAGNTIDLSVGEKFTKTCGANQAFTITNPIVGKFFYLTITGGTLAVPTFTGYTTTWILNALVTDYVPASSNILVGEITGVNTIKLFWTE